MKHIIIWLDRIVHKHKALKRWKHVVTVMAALITFATTYALILPAITVEKNSAGDVGGMYLEREGPGDMLVENALAPSEEEILEGSTGEEESAAAVDALKYLGSDYTVTLFYDAISGIPEGADLNVTEIPQTSDDYQTYLEETKKAMGLKEEDILPRFAARFFDIKIMVGGKEFKPESGVSVEITYDEPLAENPDTEVNAVHFANCIFRAIRPAVTAD